MSKHKIIGLALCGLMLTSCGNGGENTAEGTVSPETSAASESVSETSVSETTVSETETETETETEIPETSETVQEETESTENFDKVKDRVIFEDGENTLTAGQYIEALFECEEFTRPLGICRDFQITDMDENGIPEIMLYYSDHMSYTGSRLYKITATGKAEAVPILNRDIGFFSDEYELEGDYLSPYEKDGKTLWISRFNGSGTGGGFSGKYILKYDGSGIDGEVIHKSRYDVWNGYDENGELEWYREEHYYIFGEEVTEEEYEKRRDEYMNSLKPSDELHVKSSYNEDDFRETFSYALNNYLDMRDGT